MSEHFDPLAALRAPAIPLPPDPAFAARLKARLIDTLLAPPSQEEPMSDVLLQNDLSRNGTRPGDISYISLAVPDAAAARTFYGAVLGWTFAPGRVENGNQVEAVIPQVGLWGGPQTDGRLVRGAVLGFRVDDLAAAVENIRAHGGTATDPKQEPYGLAADCRDDQGLDFYLHQLPSGGSPAPSNGMQHGDISYVVLHVGDVQRAQAFFGAVVGWQFTPGHSANGANVEGPTPMIGMSGGPGSPRTAVLCYRVQDVAVAVARIRAAGGTSTEPVQRPYALEADCTDDQGISFYLHQFAD